MLALFNGCEAALWWALAIVVAVKFGRKQSPAQPTARWAVMWLVLFGISDVIEISTGAWWRPWPLLALKGTCLAALLGCGWNLVRAAARARPGGI
jgi:hypothetical protein